MWRNTFKKVAPVLQNLRVSFVERIAKGQRSFHEGFAKSDGAKIYTLCFTGIAAVTSCTVYIVHSANMKNVVKAEDENRKKTMVVLGCGWGAVNLIKSLKPGLYDVKIVSPTNYFLFTPLLPSVTVGTVDGRSLVEPIRNIVGQQHEGNIEFFEAACTDVDFEKKQVHCVDRSDIIGADDKFHIDYDILVVAVGSKTATYGNQDIEKYAHKLKNITQAQELRKNIVDVFESSAIPCQSEEEIRRLLNFVVVGGGPTGVEFASELRDYIAELKQVYPVSLINKVKITLVNSHYKVLSMFDDEISHYAEKKFKSDGIDCVGGSYVIGIDDRSIQIKDKKTKEITTMPYGICVWAAGIAPRTITKIMMQKIPNQHNRNALVTDGFLKVKNADNVFAIGDCATVEFTKLISQVKELFTEADKDGNGVLTFEEFEQFCEIAKKKFPEMTQHFNKIQASVSHTFDVIDKNKDQKLSLEEFESFLKGVDNKLKSYPATAQVAAQQGKYLGKLLTAHPEITTDNDVSLCKPFEYGHLGNFAYVGGNQAVLQLPVVGSLTGFAVMWLWRAAYLNEAVSWRMGMLIGLDWIKAHVFGRDTSRI